MVISDDHAPKPHLKRPMLSDSDVISTTISCVLVPIWIWSVHGLIWSVHGVMALSEFLGETPIVKHLRTKNKYPKSALLI